MLLALLVFAVVQGVCSGAIAKGSAIPSDRIEERSGAGADLLTTTAHVLGHGVPSERSVNTFQGRTGPRAKDSLTMYVAVVRSYDRADRSAFACRARSAPSRLAEQRRCALLFPFHHFW